MCPALGPAGLMRGVTRHDRRRERAAAPMEMGRNGRGGKGGAGVVAVERGRLEHRSDSRKSAHEASVARLLAPNAQPIGPSRSAEFAVYRKFQ